MTTENPSNPSNSSKSSPLGSKSRQPGDPSEWELLDPKSEEVITLEDLISRPPFRDTKDKQGHSMTIGARMPEWVERKIRKLIEMRGSPYELVSDVVRDTIYVGLAVLSARYKHIEDWALEGSLSKIIDTAGESRRITIGVREMLNELTALVEGGDDDVAGELLAQYLDTVASMESKWHQRKRIAQLKSSHIVTSLVEHCSDHARKLFEE